MFDILQATKTPKLMFDPDDTEHDRVVAAMQAYRNVHAFRLLKGICQQHTHHKKQEEEGEAHVHGCEQGR